MYVRSMHFTFFRSIFSGIKILKGMRSTNHSFNQQHFSEPNSLNIQWSFFSFTNKSAMLRFVEHCGNWEAWPTLKLLLKRFTPGGFKSILRNFLHSVLPPPWKWTAAAFFPPSFKIITSSLSKIHVRRTSEFPHCLGVKHCWLSNLNPLMVKHWQNQ